MSQSNIGNQIKAIDEQLGSKAKLVAVSKFHPADAIREAYAAGQRIFGENRAQEMVAKYEELKNELTDISWHFIGSLQRNKVKYIIPFVSLIQSVSSIKLLDEIERQAAKYDRKVDVLLEVHVAEEDTKSGFSEQEAFEAVGLIINHPEQYAHINLRGLMTMATNTDDEQQIRTEFRKVATLFNKIKDEIKPFDFNQLSMGMSGDYPIALAEGATLIRIGTSIFGEREY